MYKEENINFIELNNWGKKLLESPDFFLRNPKKIKEAAEKCLILSEVWSCLLSPYEKNELKNKFENILWKYCLHNISKREESKFPYFIACSIELGKSLGININYKELNSPYISNHYETIFNNKTKVFTLVTNDDPLYVYGGFIDINKNYLNEKEKICKKIIKNYLAKEFIWSISKDTQGYSWMLSVVVKSIVTYFNKYPWNKNIGCTGKLDENGCLQKIDAIEEKIIRFFLNYPQGIIILPEENYNDISKDILEEFSDKILFLSSIEELFIICGFQAKGHYLTEFYKNDRRKHKFIDWKGDILRKDQLIPLNLSNNYNKYNYIDILNKIYYKKGNKELKGIIIKGKAGYGKSILLIQCYHELLKEKYKERQDKNNNIFNFRYINKFEYNGIPLLIKLRNWISKESLEEFIVHQIKDNWTWESFIKEIEKYNLKDKICFLFDGLDEISEVKYKELERFLNSNNFKYIITTREIFNNISLINYEIFHINKLSYSDIRELLRLYNREDILKYIEDNKFYSNNNKFNFRNSILETWCTTPLNISILAVTLKDKINFIDFNLIDWIKSIWNLWLKKAEIEKRLSKSQIEHYKLKGILVLGKAVLQMFKSGRQRILQEEDIRIALTEFKGLNLIEFIEILDKPGFLIKIREGEWEFAHKQIAEYFLANYLYYSIELNNHSLEKFLNIHKEWLFDTTTDVLLFLAQLIDAEKILNWLKNNIKDYYFDILFIATNILLYLDKTKISDKTAIEWIKRRIILASYFPEECIFPNNNSYSYNENLPLPPLDLHTDILIKRWQYLLKKSFYDIINSCDIKFRNIFLNDKTINVPKEYKNLTGYLISRLKLKKYLYLFLDIEDKYDFLKEVPPENIVFFKNYFLKDKFSERAKEYFFKYAPPYEILKYLSYINSKDSLKLMKYVYNILDITAEYGSHFQQKEALIRFVAYYKKLEFFDNIDSKNIDKYWELIWRKYLPEIYNYDKYILKEARKIILTQIYSLPPVDKKLVFKILELSIDEKDNYYKRFFNAIKEGLEETEISEICWNICCKIKILSFEDILKYLKLSLKSSKYATIWKVLFFHYNNDNSKLYHEIKDIIREALNNDYEIEIKIYIIASAINYEIKVELLQILENLYLLEEKNKNEWKDEFKEVKDKIYKYLISYHYPEILKYFSQYPNIIENITRMKLSLLKSENKIFQIISLLKELKNIYENYKKDKDFIKNLYNYNVNYYFNNKIISIIKKYIIEKEIENELIEILKIIETNEYNENNNEEIIQKRKIKKTKKEEIDSIYSSSNIKLLWDKLKKENTISIEIQNTINPYDSNIYENIPTYIKDSYDKYVNILKNLLKENKEFIPNLIEDIGKIKEKSIIFKILIEILENQNLTPYYKNLEDVLNKYPKKTPYICFLLKKDISLRNRFEELIYKRVEKLFTSKTFFNKKVKFLSIYINSLYILDGLEPLINIFIRYVNYPPLSYIILDYILEKGEKISEKYISSLVNIAYKLLSCTLNTKNIIKALKILLYFGNEANYSIALKFIESNNLEIKFISLRIIYKYGNLKIINKVLPYLDHFHPSIAIISLKIINKFGNESLWDKIYEKIKINYLLTLKSINTNFTFGNNNIIDDFFNDNKIEKDLNQYLINKNSISESEIEIIITTTILNFVFSYLSEKYIIKFLDKFSIILDRLYNIFRNNIKEYFIKFKNFGRLPEHILFLINISEIEISTGIKTEEGWDVMEEDGVTYISPLIDKLIKEHGKKIIIDILLNYIPKIPKNNILGIEKIISYIGGVKLENLETLKNLLKNYPTNRNFLKYLTSLHSIKARKIISNIWDTNNMLY